MIRDRNHRFPAHLHPLVSRGLSVPSGIDDRSNVQPQGLPANPFGPPESPAKKEKKQSTTTGKAGSTSHTSLPIAKPKPKRKHASKTQQKHTTTVAVTVQAPQAPDPSQPITATDAYRARARADNLRKDYPGIEGVPETVSKIQRAMFIADYIAKKGNAEEKPVETKGVSKRPWRRSRMLAAQSSTTLSNGASKRNLLSID